MQAQIDFTLQRHRNAQRLDVMAHRFCEMISGHIDVLVGQIAIQG